MRQEFKNLNSKDEAWDVDADDENALRIALLAELESGKSEFEIKHFEEVFNKELGIFPDGKYDFVRDLKDAYKGQLSKTIEYQIFKTIPDHAFWDIKKP